MYYETFTERKGKTCVPAHALNCYFCLLSCFFYFRTTMAYEQTSDGTQAEIMASGMKYTIKKQMGSITTTVVTEIRLRQRDGRRMVPGSIPTMWVMMDI